MHMANELLSVPVAAGSFVVAGGWLGWVCRKARDYITADKFALMGVLGAFVFAGQMINFQLPAMPGTSGHLVGAVLLAIVLGPHLGAVVMTSIVIVQCLIFQDGGLLALGCNILNMALVPSYLGYYVYNLSTTGSGNGTRTFFGAMIACVIAVQVAAILVPIQVGLSGVLAVPFGTFLVTMSGVHLIIGFMEGLITIAVLGYLSQVRPDLMSGKVTGKVRLSRRGVLTSLLVMTVIIASGLSLLASGMPDGLEWSYAERPNQPEFKPSVKNESQSVEKVDKFQDKYSVMPDYSKRSSELGSQPTESSKAGSGWTSFAGLVGSLITMGLVWFIAWLLRRRKPQAETN